MFFSPVAAKRIVRRFVITMNRRESTNVKLAAIINSKNNDQEEEEAVLNEELKAKVRLRRSSLYGGGARWKLYKFTFYNKLLISNIGLKFRR